MADILPESDERQVAMLMVGALALLWFTARMFRVVIV
jgi:hypothetical protein